MFITLSKNQIKEWQAMVGFRTSENSNGSEKLYSNLVFTTSDSNRLAFYPIPCGLFHLHAIDG